MNFYFQTIKQQQYELVCDLTESFASILNRLAVTYKLDVTTLSLFYRGKAVSPNDILSTITSTPNIKFVLLIRQPKPTAATTTVVPNTLMATESSPSNKITVTSPNSNSNTATTPSATTPSVTTPSVTTPSVTTPSVTTVESNDEDDDDDDDEVEIKLEEDEPTEENTVNDNNAVEEFLNIVNGQNPALDENMEGGEDDNARMLMAAIVNMLRRGVPQEENAGEPGDNDEIQNGGMMGALLNNLLGLGNVENNVAEELSEQDVENIKQMEAMGFSTEESKEAYYICSKDVTDAVNYLLSNKEF